MPKVTNFLTNSLQGTEKKKKTFIPGIWTQSTAVPVAFERNSVKVSSAIDRSLQGSQQKNQFEQNFTTKEATSLHEVQNYPAGLLASLRVC